MDSIAVSAKSFNCNHRSLVELETAVNIIIFQIFESSIVGVQRLSKRFMDPATSTLIIQSLNHFEVFNLTQRFLV